ncbi:MAG: type 4a pilus biogenesis protein PilO [Bacillota bacterium]
MKSRISLSALITLGVVIFIVIVYIVLVYAPRNKQLDELEAKRVQKTAELEAVIREVKQLDDLKRQLAAVKDEINRLNIMLPRNKEVASLIKSIELVILRNKITFGSLASKEASESPDPRYKIIEISLQFAGKFVNIESFLTELTNMPRLITVSTFNISGDGGGQMSVQITAQAYMSTQGGFIY